MLIFQLTFKLCKLLISCHMPRAKITFASGLIVLMIFLVSNCNITESNDFKFKVLTKDSAVFDYWPCISPDGKTILFNRKTAGKGWDLLSVSSEGGEISPFFPEKTPISITRANWSKGSNLISFNGRSEIGKNSIWLTDKNGSNPRMLTISNLGDNIYYPSWYPDGKALVVVDSDEKTLKLVNIENQTAVSLTDSSKILAGMPTVSPNGKMIAFAGQENIGKTYNEKLNSIWLLNENGDFHLLENEQLQGRTPAWSPDGKWIAFESNRENNKGQYAIFIIKTDGSSLRRVTPYHLNANHPVWTPDGKRILFSSSTILDQKTTSSIVIIDI